MSTGIEPGQSPKLLEDYPVLETESVNEITVLGLWKNDSKEVSVAYRIGNEEHQRVRPLEEIVMMYPNQVFALLRGKTFRKGRDKINLQIHHFFAEVSDQDFRKAETQFPAAGAMAHSG
jgi:hypothetical protein